MRGHPELIKHKLVLGIQVLSEQDDHYHGWVPELLRPRHVFVEVVLQVYEVLLAVELDPMRLFNSHVQPLTGHLKGLEDRVGRVVLPGPIYYDPLFMLEVDRVLYG